MGSNRQMIRRDRAIMSYELFYWPTIQGRGEFVRLALALVVQTAKGVNSPVLARLIEGHGLAERLI
jgi:hypothetical protein